MGAICLGPMGNTQRGHWLFSLTSGCRVVHHCWTALPMPQEVILCVSQIGHAQGIPSCITYVNRRGDEISNHLEDFFYDNNARSSDSNDDTYTENGSHQYYEDDETTVFNDETTSSDDNDDNDPQGNPHLPANEMYDPAVPEPASSLTPTYQPYITYKGRQPILYTELNKTLYGMLQAALLFRQKLSTFLTEKHGFLQNEYDWCVVNKIVSGKQCTVT